eukprot:1529024-Prymnesium_polylepis.2
MDPGAVPVWTVAARVEERSLPQCLMNGHGGAPACHRGVLERAAIRDSMIGISKGGMKICLQIELLKRLPTDTRFRQASAFWADSANVAEDEPRGGAAVLERAWRARSSLLIILKAGLGADVVHPRIGHEPGTRANQATGARINKQFAAVGEREVCCPLKAIIMR